MDYPEFSGPDNNGLGANGFPATNGLESNDLEFSGLRASGKKSSGRPRTGELEASGFETETLEDGVNGLAKSQRLEAKSEAKEEKVQQAKTNKQAKRPGVSNSYLPPVQVSSLLF